MNWGVRASAGAALASMTFLAIVAALIGLLSFHLASRALDDLGPTRSTLAVLSSLSDTLDERASLFPKLPLALAAEERDEILRAASLADREIAAQLRALGTLGRIDEPAMTRLTAVHRQLSELFALVRQQTAEPAGQTLTGSLESWRAIHAALDEGRRLIRDATQRLRQEINATNDAIADRFVGAERLLIVTIVVSLLLSRLIHVFIDRVIVSRLRRLQFAIRAHMAGGAADFACGGRDEIAEVGNALQHLVAAIAEREHDLNTFRMAVEHSPTTTVITDVRGQIRYVNPKFTACTGYAADEVLGRTPALLKSGLTPPELYRDLWSSILAGREWHGKFCNLSKSGDLYWEDTRIAPLRGEDGGLTGFVAVKEDITERLRIEEELQAAKEIAENSARSKSDFLAMMSHEIRTPMNGILGMVRLLLDTPMSPQQRDYLETVHYSSEALLTILNDILDFSKLEAGKLEVTPIDIDLPRLVASVAELMRSRAEGKGLSLLVTFDHDVPRYVRVDPTRLRQVLLNLTGNAIKFTDAGSVSVVVRVAGEEQGQLLVRFAIVDTGIGIAPDAQARLFSSFTQADGSIARRFGGTGLGLAISKRLVTLMGGRIAVESTEGQGATFWFELPLKVADAAAVHAATRPGGAAIAIPPLNILLAEDNEVNQKVAVGLLSQRGHSVAIAKDGAEAVEMALTGAFDVVLMDMQMPEVDGLEATRRIRACADPIAAIPIIAMTANALKGDQERCLAAGMDGYVAKPIDPEQIDLALARHVLRREDEAAAPSRVSSALDDLRAVLGEPAVAALCVEFLHHAQAARASIARALDAGDLLAAAAAAHDLKATAATFGLPKLAALVEAIEMAARNGRAQETGRLAADLPYRIERAERRLAPVTQAAGA